MRKLVFLFKRELGAGKARFDVEKMRVVTETAAPAWQIDDRSLPSAFGQYRLGVVAMAHEREHAVIMRAAISDARELFDQLGVVAGVGRRLSREASRLHAGRAVQRVDTYARVIGKRRQVRQAAGVPRLDKGVFDKRVMR